MNTMKFVRASGWGVALLVAGMAASVSAAVPTVTTNGQQVVVTGSGTLTEPFLAPAVDTVKFNGSGAITYSPITPSTYAGGTEIVQSQVKVQAEHNEAFGTGAIALGTEAKAALLAWDRDLVFDNKIVFGQNNTYVAGYTEYSTVGRGKITLKSVGTPADAAAHAIRIGREGANSQSRAVLALTGADSEAISEVRLSGSVELTLDGGTLRARSDAKSPFFSQFVAGESAVTVTKRGFAMEVVEGGAVELGQPLLFEYGERTNVVETLTPDNHTFENGSTGWTITPGLDDRTGVLTATSSDPFSSNGAYPPPGDDLHYVMLRRAAKVSRTIQFPTAGYWRVVYWRGGRLNYSNDMKVTVTLGDVVLQELPGRAECEFAEQQTEPAQFEAGQDYLLTIAASESGGNAHSVNVDCISFERVEVENFTGPLTKTGGGTWELRQQDLLSGELKVDAGQVRLGDLTVDGGTAIQVASGAELKTRNVMLAEASSVTVAAGGTWCLADTDESILVNGDFEQQQYNFQAVTPTGWTLTREVTPRNEGSGLVHVGDAVLGGMLPAEGNEAAYLRELTTLSQVFTVPESEAGNYRLSFARASRGGGYPSQAMPVEVYVDGELVGSSPGQAAGAQLFERYAFEVELTGGEHTLSLRVGTVDKPIQGQMVFVDDVRLNRITPMGEVTSAVALNAGATLRLENACPCRLLNLTVDGEPVAGGAAELRARGIAVTGSGSLRVGPRGGMVIILR